MPKARAVEFDSKTFVQSMYDKAVSEYWTWRRSNGGYASCGAHLYFRRSGPGAPGDVTLIAGDAEEPEGFESAMPMSLAWSDDQTKRKIWQTLQAMPILP